MIKTYKLEVGLVEIDFLRDTKCWKILNHSHEEICVWPFPYSLVPIKIPKGQIFRVEAHIKKLKILINSGSADVIGVFDND